MTIDAPTLAVDACAVGNYDDAARLLHDLEQRHIDDPAITAAMAQAYASLAVADAFSRRFTVVRTGGNRTSEVERVQRAAAVSREEPPDGPESKAERIKRVARQAQREERKPAARPDLITAYIRRRIVGIGQQHEQR